MYTCKYDTRLKVECFGTESRTHIGNCTKKNEDPTNDKLSIVK